MSLISGTALVGILGNGRSTVLSRILDGPPQPRWVAHPARPRAWREAWRPSAVVLLAASVLFAPARSLAQVDGPSQAQRPAQAPNASGSGAQAAGSASQSDLAPVRVAQSFLAGGFDPAQGGNGWSLQSHGVMEPLFTVARDMTVQPHLAQGFEREADGLRITLRPGLKFSDGSAVDSAAVVAALARTAARSSLAASRTGALRLRVHSAREFSVGTEKPVGRLEAVLAEFPFVIYGEREGGRFVGTGRYMAAPATAAEAGKPLRLVPNPHHWQGVAQREVLISRVTSADLLSQVLEFGEVDLAFNVPAADAARLAADPRFTLHRTLVAYQYMLLVNTRSAALADVRVRRALALAVDREALVRRVDGEPARGLYPSVWPFALAKPLSHDAAQARRLLDEAGWRAGADGMRQKDGRPLQLRLMHYAQRPDFGLLAPLLAQQLAAVGVRAVVEASPNVNDTMARRDFDLAFWTMNTAPGGDPTYVLDQYFSSLGTINYSNWQSLDFDEALAVARRARDAQGVSAAVATVERLLAEEVPAIFLLTPRWVTVSNERLRGYQAYPSDYYIVNGSIR